MSGSEGCGEGTWGGWWRVAEHGAERRTWGGEDPHPGGLQGLPHEALPRRHLVSAAARRPHQQQRTRRGTAIAPFPLCAFCFPPSQGWVSGKTVPGLVSMEAAWLLLQQRPEGGCGGARRAAGVRGGPEESSRPVFPGVWGLPVCVATRSGTAGRPWEALGPREAGMTSGGSDRQGTGWLDEVFVGVGAEVRREEGSLETSAECNAWETVRLCYTWVCAVLSHSVVSDSL